MADSIPLAPLGRRIIALIIDWGLSMAISAGFFQFNEFATLGAFALMQFVLVGTMGSSIGHLALGLGVRQLNGQLPGPLKALGRTVLLCLVIPGIFTVPDGRSYHDALMKTTIIRIR